MKKQEIIAEAWGIDRFNVLSPKINDNGWLDEDYLLNKHEFNLADCDTENGAYIGLDDLTTYYRPKSLKGIEDNNGWIKIDSRDDLPKNDGMYLFLFSDGSIIQQWHQDDISIGGVTHWRPIVKIPNPLY